MIAAKSELHGNRPAIISRLDEMDELFAHCGAFVRSATRCGRGGKGV
jgi:hypothetical protein